MAVVVAGRVVAAVVAGCVVLVVAGRVVTAGCVVGRLRPGNSELSPFPGAVVAAVVVVAAVEEGVGVGVPELVEVGVGVGVVVTVDPVIGPPARPEPLDGAVDGALLTRPEAVVNAAAEKMTNSKEHCDFKYKYSKSLQSRLLYLLLILMLLFKDSVREYVVLHWADGLPTEAAREV